MEQEQMDMEQTQEQTPVYTPRPTWQRVLAWIWRKDCYLWM